MSGNLNIYNLASVFAFTISLMFLCPSIAYSQTVHINDLDRLQVRIRKVQDNPAIVDSVFFEYSIAENKSQYPRRGRLPGFIDLNVPAWVIDQSTLLIEEHRLLMVFLHDQGWERQENILTFWRVHGDSLEFFYMDPRSYTSGLGSFYLHQYVAASDSLFLLVLRKSGGDDDVFFDSYYFMRYEPNKIPQLIFEKGYEGSTGRPHHDLSYQILDQPGDIAIKFKERHYTALDSLYQRAFLYADSSYVVLSENLRVQQN